MATYFGEVQELVSRAVEGDESEELPIYSFKINTTIANGALHQCNTLIVCVGDTAKAFSQCYLSSDRSKKLLDIEYVSSNTENQSSLYGEIIKTQKPKEAVHIYTSDSEFVVCESSSSLPEYLHADLFETISKYVQCSRAVILTSAPVASHKGSNSLDNTPFLMCLPNSQWTPAISFLRLQSPNFISGMAAQILTDFEIKRKPAICIVNFVDSDFLDYANVQAFEQVIDVGVLKGVEKKNAKSVLLDYVRKHSNESNLYI